MKILTPKNNGVFAMLDADVVIVFQQMYVPDYYILNEELIKEFSSKEEAYEFYGFDENLIEDEKKLKDNIESIFGENLSDSEIDKYIVEVETIKRKHDLVALPQPGEVWNKNSNYITDDTAIDDADGLLYTALRYSKGKRPSLSPTHWYIPSSEIYTEWSSVSDGTQLSKNEIYSHNGQNWTVKKQHFKATMFEPEEGSTYWTLVV